MFDIFKSNRSIYIFAIDSTEGARAAFHKWLGHYGIDAQGCEGCYKGEREESFAVDARDAARSDFWHQPFIANQESVLLLSKPYSDKDMRRDGSLQYVDGRPDCAIGTWRPVMSYHALQQDAWTFSRGHHYICN